MHHLLVPKFVNKTSAKMARTKKRTMTPFVGCRKNKYLARKIEPVIEEPIGEDVGHQAEKEARNHKSLPVQQR